MEVKYVIDSREFVFECPDNQVFETGENIVLSNIETDLIFNQSWYDDGYKVLNVFENKDFEKIKKGITSIVKKLVSDLQINVENFCLEDYHSYITNNEDHFKIVNKTRDLFAEDFDFDIMSLIKYFENQIGIELTDCFPSTGERLHIIVRINRPFSNDYNPPHQDIDNNQRDPMVNIWIPISGVNQDSSLCVVKGSHLLSMDKVLKSVEGGLMGKNNYSVRMIKSWNGSNQMTRVHVKEGDVLFFTPFLIHGMAYNNNVNQTRVALEFRLFKK